MIDEAHGQCAYSPSSKSCSPVVFLRCSNRIPSSQSLIFRFNHICQFTIISYFIHHTTMMSYRSSKLFTTNPKFLHEWLLPQGKPSGYRSRQNWFSALVLVCRWWSAAIPNLSSGEGCRLPTAGWHVGSPMSTGRRTQSPACHHWSIFPNVDLWAFNLSKCWCDWIFICFFEYSDWFPAYRIYQLTGIQLRENHPCVADSPTFSPGITQI